MYNYVNVIFFGFLGCLALLFIYSAAVEDKEFRNNKRECDQLNGQMLYNKYCMTRK